MAPTALPAIYLHAELCRGDTLLSKEFNDGNLFEKEVRAIARQLWPSAEYHGAQILDGRERDGVFVLEDAVHCLECTISKDEKKARSDLEKLASLIEVMKRQFPKKSVRGWFVTLHEATADQGRYIIQRRGLINHETFDNFRSKLVHASEIIQLRMRYAFGSARNIENDSWDIPPDEYVESYLFPDGKSSPLTCKQVARVLLEQDKSFVLFGDYGVGKSMALRQVFIELARAYQTGNDLRFPIYINLRDHREISDVSDALRQHARLIGYKEEAHLLRAFRAGYTIVILDGFDEAAPRVGTRDRQKARELRKSALALVRRFIREAPTRTSIMVAGRNNFFDNDDETREALGIGVQFQYLSLTEFSDEQIVAYLNKKGVLNVLPSWLPRKALLIGHFVTRNRASLLESGLAEPDPGTGWHALIDAICQREVSQLEVGIYASELSALYARIATKARKKASQLGPVTFDEMREAFREIFDFDAEDRALTALLRLPGLTSVAPDASLVIAGGADARWFVDASFSNAVAARDMLPLVSELYRDSAEIYRGVRHQLSAVGISVAAAICEKEGLTDSDAITSLIRMTDRSSDSVVAIDLLQIARELGLTCINKMIVFSGQTVEELYLNVDNCDLSKLFIQDSYFHKAFIDAENTSYLPRFSSCYFGEIRTPLPLEQLTQCFTDCEHDKVDIVRPAATVNVGDVRIGILKSILDKLFVQSLSGREERALARGIPPQALEYVQPTIDALRRHNFCFRRTHRGTPIWYPVRSQLGEVRRYLEMGDLKNVELMNDILKL